MTDDEPFAPRPVAGGFMPAAVASLLFMGLGCVMFLMQVLADPSVMPLDQRAAHDAQPVWVTIAMGIAVGVGAIAAVMLVLRNRLAEPLMTVALAAVLLWLAGLLLVSGLRENMSANDLIVAIVVTALIWTIFWFARHSRQRGWLS